jgi:hypothetical protein
MSSSSASDVTKSSGESVDTLVAFENEPLLFSLSVVENMQDAVSSNGPAASINISTDIQSKDDLMLKRWMRRLNTLEDSFSIHKLSAVLYTISSFTLMGTAATRWIIGRQELFATVPDYLEPVMWAFCISNFFMCAASIRMAWLYRSNNVASRNAFVGVAGSSLFSAYFLVWAGPFAPEQMTAPLASQIGFGILCAWNIILILDTMIRASEIIDDRRDNRSQEENASYGLEYLRYIASAAWPLPVVVSTGYINAVLYDHGWLISVFDQVLQKDDFGLQASVFYNNVGKFITTSHLRKFSISVCFLQKSHWHDIDYCIIVFEHLGGSMAASYAAFFITLRDKMLISKRIEWIGISAFSVPILIWTVDISSRIVPYVLGLLQLDQ